MKIAVFSTQSYDKEYLDKFKEDLNLTYFEASLNTSTVSLTKGYDVVCAFVNDKLDKETIDTLAKNGVKAIAMRCAGYNNVDLTAAADNNITVMHVPVYSPHAIAEHAVALILTLNRKTHKAYNRVREGNFSLQNLTGFDLYNKTVGVIGTGEIGAIFCKIMLGFGCKVLAFDMVESAELKSAGVQFESMENILKQSDIISLHCPLTPKTFHLFDEEAFAKMKKGAMLINTSRGGVIDTSAVIEALKNRTLGYLGIDVYEQEDKLFFHDLSESVIQDDQIQRLISFPNVLITSHQGFFTKEALDQIAITTLKNITNFASGNTIENEVKLNK
ncbi:2-hydroxyacid dehydrogenase [Arcticibacterium luteifluviistationis]|uniref:Hydroxyacid dehydrogenase n=1 Tax=Arcticibacterium luteifluviistationis TaxID=1784714 RepID=A0A2Z4GC58_9BACT|nr:2-hydroxyacid dehydrogenase [Arcticibacterium luteifluviistationis]AWV98806.1 hydroxyacid dehydrogenase [Arcticibacterium luteifluviistationis]